MRQVVVALLSLLLIACASRRPITWAQAFDGTLGPLSLEAHGYRECGGGPPRSGLLRPAENAPDVAGWSFALGEGYGSAPMAVRVPRRAIDYRVRVTGVFCSAGDRVGVLIENRTGWFLLDRNSVSAQATLLHLSIEPGGVHAPARLEEVGVGRFRLTTDSVSARGRPYLRLGDSVRFQRSSTSSVEAGLVQPVFVSIPEPARCPMIRVATDGKIERIPMYEVHSLSLERMGQWLPLDRAEVLEALGPDCQPL